MKYEKFLDGKWVTIEVATNLKDLSQDEKDLMVRGELCSSQWSRLQKSGDKK